MANVIQQSVEAARRGEHRLAVGRMRSGWLMFGHIQPLPGYCLLFADPVVESPNALDEAERARYSLDVLRIGDALMEVTGAYRINYETLGNLEPALHTHVIPRFLDEPDEKRRGRAFQAYDWEAARRFDPELDSALMDRIGAWLRGRNFLV